MMGSTNFFARRTVILLIVLSVLSDQVAPINGNAFGYFGGRGPATNQGKVNIKKNGKVEESMEEEEVCERLPPKYSNSSGSLEFASFDLLHLLKHGTDIIDQAKYADEAILILGNTGSGKTTISQILSGKLDAMHAVLTQSERLVIIDDNYKISGPSTTSKTLIPELVVTQDADTVLYDCPGFDDTRGPEQDLAANFFMNHVVKRKVGQVKMLFLVIHSSVKLGNDRLDFDLLTTHAAKFVKNLRKYQNSIGLVVTKVNSYNARGRYIPDKTILNEITEFLQFYNESLSNKLSVGASKLSPEEKKAIEQKMQFVDILLQRDDNGDITRISFSRDPEKCGPLSQSTQVAQTLQRLQDLYKSKLQFTFVNNTDFGYTLKDSTTLSIRTVSQNVNREIATNLEKHISRFDLWMDTQIYPQQNENLTRMLNTTSKVHTELAKLADGLKSEMEQTSRENATVDLIYMAKMLAKTLRKLGFHLSSHFLTFIERQQAYIEFFNANDSSRIGETWTQAVEKQREEYAGRENWLKLCQDAETAVGKYSFHTRKSSAARGDGLSGWVSFLEVVAGIRVSPQMKTFARRLDEKAEIPLFGKVLKDLMDSATKKSELKCNDTSVYISGSFVQISKFSDKLNANNMLCGTVVRKVEIYASHTVFLDADISAVGKELNLVIIAPNWRVVGKRHFNLKGYDSPAISPRKAQSGREGYGENGTDGKPGLPGGPGGSIFGVGSRVQKENDGDSLTITCDGGTGGQGQDGGDGGRGSDGREWGQGSEAHEVTDLNLLVYKATRKEYVGHSGTPGGNGGLGGLGGLPGKPGTCEMNLLSDQHVEYSKTVVVTSENAGKLGEHGESGKGGTGGKPGNALTCKKRRILFWNVDLPCTPTEPRSHPGADGVTWYGDYNTRSLQPSKPRNYNILKWQSVSNFMDGMSLNVPLSTTAEFMDAVDSKSFIVGDVTDQLRLFLQEFRNMARKEVSEKMCSRFVAKLERFARKAESYSQVTKVVHLLLAEAYSKLASLKPDGVLSLATDNLHDFLKGTQAQLEAFSRADLMDSVALLVYATNQFEKSVLGKVERVRNWEKEVLIPSLTSAMEHKHEKWVILEEDLAHILNHTDGDPDHVQWQMKSQVSIQETLELRQISYVLSLTVNIINFLGDQDLMSILIRPELKNTTAINQEADALVTLTSAWLASRAQADQTSTASIYLGNMTLSKLHETFSEQDVNGRAKLAEVLKQVALLTEDAYEKRVAVDASFEPLVKSIHAYFSKLRFSTRSLNDIPNAAPLWQVPKQVKAIRETLKNLADGMNDAVTLEALSRIHDGLIMISDLYSAMEQYQYLLKLKMYLGSAASLEPITDGTMLLASVSIEKQIFENMQKREYERAWHQLKLWSFPFAKLYEKKNPVSYLMQVREWEAMAGTTGQFKQSDFIDKPFYVWDKVKFNKEIKDLLSGKRVSLRADVARSIQDAVKFTKIGLKFKIQEDIEEISFKRLLQEIRVEMKHSGLSYFKWENNSFPILAKNVSLTHDFQNSETSLAKAENTYLSPYTVWTIQLKKAVNENVILTEEEDDGIDNFEMLQRWAKWVEVELVGTGEYVDKNEIDKNLELKRFYDLSLGEETDEKDDGNSGHIGVAQEDEIENIHEDQATDYDLQESATPKNN